MVMGNHPLNVTHEESRGVQLEVRYRCGVTVTFGRIRQDYIKRPSAEVEIAFDGHPRKVFRGP